MISQNVRKKDFSAKFKRELQAESTKKRSNEMKKVMTEIATLLTYHQRKIKSICSTNNLHVHLPKQRRRKYYNRISKVFRLPYNEYDWDMLLMLSGTTSRKCMNEMFFFGFQSIQLISYFSSFVKKKVFTPNLRRFSPFSPISPISLHFVVLPMFMKKIFLKQNILHFLQCKLQHQSS